MTRWKVALVCDWFLPRIGGLELLVRDLARALNQRGHEAHIICSTREPPNGTDSLELQGLTVHRLQAPLLPQTQTVFSRHAVTELERLLLRERYDLIHAHTILSPLAHAATFLAHRHRLPSLLTEHSVLRGASMALLRALAKISGFASWPTLLTAVSRYVAEDLRQLSGREAHVLHNATDLTEWYAAGAGRAESPAETQHVATVMRFTRRKRPVDIVRMIPQLQRHLPHELWPRFTLVGDGPEMPRVRREIERLGVSPWVELPGFLPRPRIREILARAAVFVMPCRKEAMSIASVEARAMGLPVLARRPNGVSDVIEHGVHGFLAASDEEFVGCLAQLLSDAGLRQRMSEETRRGLERFSWDHSIRRHIELYELARERVHGAGRGSSGAEQSSYRNRSETLSDTQTATP